MKRVTKVCKVDGCDEPVKARGWCTGHYQRWCRYRDVHPEVPLAGGRGRVRRSPDPIGLPAGVDHGTERAYRRGCGCAPCRAAHLAALRRWRDRIPDGLIVPGAEVADHLDRLLDDGWTRGRICAAAGITRATLARVAAGRRVRRDTLEAVLAVRPCCEGCGGEPLAGGRWCGVGRCAAVTAETSWSWSRRRDAA